MKWLLLFLLLPGAIMAEEIPYPNFKEPTGQGWDKPLHFAAGALANEYGGVAYDALCKLRNEKPNPKVKAVVGLMLSLLAGTGKELLDSREKGNKFDPKDLAATVAGGIPASFIRFTF